VKSGGLGGLSSKKNDLPWTFFYKVVLKKVQGTPAFRASKVPQVPRFHMRKIYIPLTNYARFKKLLKNFIKIEIDF